MQDFLLYNIYRWKSFSQSYKRYCKLPKNLYLKEHLLSSYEKPMYPYRTVEELLQFLPPKNRAACEKLWTFFRENCPEAPGSSHNHQTRKGWYFGHLTDIMNYAALLYDQMWALRPLPFSLPDALLVLFLHDIEKPIKYTSSMHMIAEGKTSEEIRQKLIDEYEILLTDEQRNGFNYVHGEVHWYRSDARVATPLAAFCHCCDMISARIYFNYPMKQGR